jgi:hypothetical protein
MDSNFALNQPENTAILILINTGSVLFETLFNLNLDFRMDSTKFAQDFLSPHNSQLN